MTRQNVRYCNSVTFQIRVALHFLLKIGNRKSHWSDVHVVWMANHWTCLSQYRGVKYLAQKEGNSILVRVAKLLRLSIVGVDDNLDDNQEISFFI